MQAKDEMEAIKNLNEKIKVERTNLEYINGWQANGQNDIFKVNNIVFINISVRLGKNKAVATLPEGYRPSQSLMRTLVGNNGNIGYVLVAISGEITFEQISLPTTNNETFMTSFTFQVI